MMQLPLSTSCLRHPLSCTQLTQFQKQSHFLEEILRVQDADHQQEVWSGHQQSEDLCPKEQLEYASDFEVCEHIPIIDISPGLLATMVTAAELSS